MSRSGNFFSNSIGLNNFWRIKLDIHISKFLKFFYLYIVYIIKYLEIRNIFIITSSFKFFRGIFFLIFYFFFSFIKIKKKVNIYFFYFFIFYNYYILNFFFFKNVITQLSNIFSINFFVKLFFLLYIYLNSYFYNFFLFNFSFDYGFSIKLYSFNSIKLKLIINFLKLKFMKKFNFFFKIYLRSLNNKFINFINYKDNFFFKGLNSIILGISRCFYSVIFKTGVLLINYLEFLISSWQKTHLRIFRLICELFRLFYKSKILNVKGIYLKIKGKINGKMRKRKLIFKLGFLPFNFFKSKVDYNFFSKLTIFGSLGIKLWLIFY